MSEVVPRPYHALRHRLWLLGFATLVSIIGTQMQNVGIDGTSISSTHRRWRSASRRSRSGCCRSSRSRLGGVVADRHDRKRVAFATQTVMASCALLLAVATLLHRETVWLIYLLTAAASAATAFDNPARQALIPRLVPLGRTCPGPCPSNLTFFHVAMIAGPAASGS